MDYHQVRIHPEASVAPNATIVGNVEVGKGALVLFGATLRGDCGSRIVVGEGSNVQECACLHVDEGCECRIGEGVTIGHGAIVHGCTVEDNTLIGMGSIVMNRAHVGRNCLVAAGAVVTEGVNIPDGSLVMGVPGKVRRALTPDEIEGNRKAARDYGHVAADLVESGVISKGSDIPSGIPTIALAKEAPSE